MRFSWLEKLKKRVNRSYWIDWIIWRNWNNRKNREDGVVHIELMYELMSMRLHDMVNDVQHELSLLQAKILMLKLFLAGHPVLATLFNLHFSKSP